MNNIYSSSVAGVINRTFDELETCLATHFVISDFQRPYCWSMQDIQKLLDDIDELRFSSEYGNYRNEDQYYLGSICLRYLPERRELEILDGQQRLTSIMILASVLISLTQNIVDEKIKNLVEEIENKLACESDQAWDSVISYDNPKSIGNIESNIVNLRKQYRYLEIDSTEKVAGEESTFYEKILIHDLKRLLYILNRGVFSVKIIHFLSEAEQYFQGENNRGLQMTLLEILRTYHMRYSEGKEIEISSIWSEFNIAFSEEDQIANSATEGELSRTSKDLIEQEVIPALLIKHGIAPWDAYKVENADKLKGIMGSYQHDRIVDEKFKNQITETDRPYDLLDIIHPGLPFFKMLSQYHKISKAIEQLKEKGFDYTNGLYLTSDQLSLVKMALIAWVDRFLLRGQLEKDSNGIAECLAGDVEFRSYAHVFVRFMNRLRYQGKEKSGAFGRLDKIRLICLLKYDKPQDNLILLPHRTTSPASCRRALSEYINPDYFGKYCLEPQYAVGYCEAVKYEESKLKKNK